MTKGGGYGSVYLACLLVCCGGRSASRADLRAQGGSAGDSTATAGSTANAGADSAGAGGAVSPGTPSVGGTPPSDIAGAGGEASGVAGADTGTGGESPVVDHSHARWPMPNSVSSGLPHPLSYDLSSADVVTDNVTGLVWERVSISAVAVTLAAETGHCQGLSLAGHKHWRVPTRIELISLMAAVDDTLRDEDFPNVRVPKYLSSSRFNNDVDPETWRVSLAGWSLDHSPASGTGYARCVWSDDSLVTDPTPPAREAKGNVVVDAGTGLTWERTPGFAGGHYADASAYCASLSLAGFDDWRMPSMQELLSLAELQQLSPAINTADFPAPLGVNGSWYWTATRYPPGGFAYAPGVSFDLLAIMGSRSQDELEVRCVR